MTKATWPLAGTAVVAAALALPGGAAYATTTPPPTVNQGNTSVGSGNQALISLSAPVNICGIAVAVLGSAQAGCQGGAVARSAPIRFGGGTAPGTNIGNTSVGSGNKVTVPLSVPVNICGVSIAAIGSAKSGCQGSATVDRELPPPNSGPPSGPTLPGPTPKPKHHKPPKHHRHQHGHHGCTAENCTTGGGSKNGGGSTGSTTLTSTTQNTQNTQNAQSTQNGQGAQIASALGSLPTTGMNLAGILASALGMLGAGAGVMLGGRRRAAREGA